MMPSACLTAKEAALLALWYGAVAVALFLVLRGVGL